MHGKQPRANKSAVVQKLHGADARRGPRRIPGADLLQDLTPRAAAMAHELALFDRFGHMHAVGRKWIAIDRFPDRAEDERADGIRRVRREARAHALGGPKRFDLAGGVFDEGVGVVDVEAQYLEKHDGGEPAARKRRKRHQRVADVADKDRAEGDGFRDGQIHGVENFRRGQRRSLSPRGHHRANPGDKCRGRRHLVP